MKHKSHYSASIRTEAGGLCAEYAGRSHGCFDANWHPGRELLGRRSGRFAGSREVYQARSPGRRSWVR